MVNDVLGKLAVLVVREFLRNELVELPFELRSLGDQSAAAETSLVPQVSEEKPLFGKLTGRFWWEHHVRGSADDGVVVKDYEVRKDPRTPNS